MSDVIKLGEYEKKDIRLKKAKADILKEEADALMELQGYKKNKHGLYTEDGNEEYDIPAFLAEMEFKMLPRERLRKKSLEMLVKITEGSERITHQQELAEVTRRIKDFENSLADLKEAK
jgi:hypothetical protein